ncbi:recombinase family protein [Brevibacillus brevis]|uniref:recombinase family protein n=1 Tax=Brevibacillus brevis TaxID=1393 RepID=UPI00256FE0A0|nr:recombinase family protein [Lysinibacillus sp. SDF0063]
MLRLGIYARVSSDDQAERGTIETQLEFARKYADLHQLEIVKWYKDDGVKIRSMTEPFDTGDPSGRFLLTIT